MGHAFGLVSITASVVMAAASGASAIIFEGSALIAIVGGVVAAVYTAKYKARLGASEGAAQAWREERDAEKAKSDRLERDLRVAEARTDITHLETLVTGQHNDLISILDAVKDSLRATTTAVEFLSKQSYDESKPRR